MVTAYGLSAGEKLKKYDTICIDVDLVSDFTEHEILGGQVSEIRSVNLMSLNRIIDKNTTEVMSTNPKVPAISQNSFCVEVDAHLASPKSES